MKLFKSLLLVMVLASLSFAQVRTSTPANVTLLYNAAQSLTLNIIGSTSFTLVPNQYADGGIQASVTYNLSAPPANGIQVVPYFTSAAALTGSNNSANTIPTSLVNIEASYNSTLQGTRQPCTLSDSTTLGLGANTCPFITIPAAGLGSTGTKGGIQFALILASTPSVPDNYSGVLNIQATTF